MAGRLHLGDFHPHLESAFTRVLRDLAPDGDAGEVLLVAANRRLGAHLPRRAAELGVATRGLEARALEELIDELARPRLAAAGRRRLAAWEAPLLVAEVTRPLLRSRPRSYFAAAAEHGGLFRVLASTLGELRDAGVGPEDLEAAGAAAAQETIPAGGKLADLVEIYRGYLRALSERGLADDAEAAGEAVAALRAGELGGRPLLLYGVYDLVERQRRVVAALLDGRRAEVFFPWGDGEAFAYARPLRAWFERLGLRPALEETSGGRAGDVEGSDLERLRARLFSAFSAPDGAPAAAAAAPAPAVRFLSAPNPQREAREVVRRVTSPEGSGSSLVLLRQAEAAAPDYRSLARLAGVPLELAAGEPWRRLATGRALLALLALAADRRQGVLTRATVEDLLATGALRADLFPAGAQPGRWAQALRRRGLVQDLAAWRRLVERHAGGAAQRELPFAVPAPAAGAERDEDAERDPALRRELPLVAAWVERLLAALSGLAESAGWREFASRLAELGRGWLRPGEERDGVLAALAPLASLHGVVAFSFRAAREAVEELLASPGPPARQPEAAAATRPGGGAPAPGVSDLLAARGVTADRVVVPGLVERSFPRRPRPDPVLLDEERLVLNRFLPAVSDGLALPPRDDAAALAEERLLLRLAVGAARRELVLAWPRSGEDGRPLVPSTFLLDAGRALTGREIGFEELRDAGGPLRVERVPLSPFAAALAADAETALHPWEYDLGRIAAARRAGGGGGRRLSYLLAVVPRLGPSLEAEERRHGFAGASRLSEFDGLVGERLGAAWLDSRRREDGAVALSASALEAYAQCSFHFFHREVLRLESQPAPERRLDLEPREVGVLYHQLLRDLYRRLDAEGLLPLDERRLERAASLVPATLEALLAGQPALAGEAPQPLWLARRRRLESDARAVLAAQAREAAAGWRPRGFEVPLGEGDGEPIVCGETTVALRGRLDRVDARPGALRVVDYKTGRLARPTFGDAGDLRGGRRMQLALYRLALLAAERRPLEDDAAAAPPAVHGVYQGVEARSGYRAIAWSPGDFERVAAEVESVLAAILDGVARGEFFQVERESFCERACAYAEICGPGRTRLVLGKASDPRAARAARWRRLELEGAAGEDG